MFSNNFIAVAPSLSASFAGVSALIAVIALLLQVKNIRQARSIDLILKFEDRFWSSHFKQIRSGSAYSLMNYLFPTGGGNVKASVNEEVFDFFETLGLMFGRYKLDEELVWNTFFEWVRGYWESAEKYILEERKRDACIWQEFERLYHGLMKVNKKRIRISHSDNRLSDKEIADFLIGENKLWNPGEIL